ncbi:hypothetical protein NJF54_05320 [Pseudomonas guariconensis]|uniref:hypothetical protein n=1 Tax=Pseudomonas guariconensis TaxID=1288410 RepID=UPI00209AE6FF|nr:hypothetical protein [Pseudomonas guariconensis]MCO7631248.1 hypothetical protein [Pseudomonas guariconensis]
MFQFVKTTIAGGVLFILPLVLVVVLIEKAIHLLSAPLQKVLPFFAGFSIAGVTAVSIVAVIALGCLCFVAGLLARTAFAARVLQGLVNRVLGNLPGYQLLKDATARLTGMENIDGAKVGLLAENDGYRFCLVLEALDEWLLVYLPDGGPAGGTAGEVRVMPKALVQITDIPWLGLLACLRRGGRGALELTAGVLKE